MAEEVVTAVMIKERTLVHLARSRGLVKTFSFSELAGLFAEAADSDIRDMLWLLLYDTTPQQHTDAAMWVVEQTERLLGVSL